MCRTRKRLLQKWKAHTRRLMFVCLVIDVVSTILTNKPKKLIKGSKTLFGNVCTELSVPLELLQQIILTMKSKNHNNAICVVYLPFVCGEISSLFRKVTSEQTTRF